MADDAPSTLFSMMDVEEVDAMSEAIRAELLGGQDKLDQLNQQLRQNRQPGGLLGALLASRLLGGNGGMPDVQSNFLDGFPLMGGMIVLGGQQPDLPDLGVHIDENVEQ